MTFLSLSKLSLTKPVKLLLLFSLIILSESCAPIYIPSDINAPLFTNEGEAVLSLNYGSNGFNYQAAYALSENLAFQINGQSMSQDVDNDTKQSTRISDPKQTISYHEAAFGFFNSINESTVIEIFAGFGFGNASAFDKYNIFTSDKIYAEGEYYKLFLQADIGAKMKFLEGGFAIRLAELHYNDLRFENYEFTGEPNSIFFEPALFLRLGGPNFKVKTQIGFASKLKDEEFIQYESMTMSIGFIIRLNTIFE